MHLAAKARRKGARVAVDLVVRGCAVIVTSIGLLAMGRRVFWLQLAAEVGEADWQLFSELQSEPGFAPPDRVCLSPSGARAAQS